MRESAWHHSAGCRDKAETGVVLNGAEGGAMKKAFFRISDMLALAFLAAPSYGPAQHESAIRKELF
jgi:hypothetical protein